MSIEFICTHCGKTLRVPDEHLGKKARCPSCQSINVIQPSDTAMPESDHILFEDQIPNSSGGNWSGPPPKYAAPPKVNPFEATTYSEGVRYRSPHRGGLVLTLGIVSFFCNFFLIPGIMAWIYGSTDLKQMKAGIMDREGETMTMVGMILGIISTLLPLVGILIYILFVIVVIFFGVLANA